MEGAPGFLDWLVLAKVYLHCYRIWRGVSTAFYHAGMSSPPLHTSTQLEQLYQDAHAKIRSNPSPEERPEREEVIPKR